MAQIGWALDHLADLESDFSVFHRIDREQMYRMPGPEFFSKAWRIGAYGGVVTALMSRERDNELADPETAGVPGTPNSGWQAGNGQAGPVTVPFEVFRAAHPDIVSHAVVGEG